MRMDNIIGSSGGNSNAVLKTGNFNSFSTRQKEIITYI